jgi:hypothetical protein
MTEREAEASGRYLVDDEHWRIAPVREFAAFFRAVHLLALPEAFVALADGAWPREVQDALGPITVDPGAAVRGRLADEFRQALCVPVGDAQMAALAALAEKHAEPEIAHRGVQYGRTSAGMVRRA